MATAADFSFTAWRLKTGSAVNAAQSSCHTRIRDREGRLHAVYPGDYVIREYDGSLSVMKEPDFEAEYEAVSTPAAPTALATSAQETDSITLTWTDGASSQGVEVFRDNVLIATVAAGAQTYEDDDAALVPNHVYVYKVRSIINEARSAFTSNLTAYTDPLAPTNCAVEITGATTATVTWTDVPGDADVEYQVDVDGTPSGTAVAAGVGTKDITGLTTATQYDFTVRAVGITSTQSSAASNTATDTTE